MIKSLTILLAWVLDRLLGDPRWLPHPVVAFGRAIAFCEHGFNRGRCRRLKGALVAIGLVVAVFLLSWGLLRLVEAWQPIVAHVLRVVLAFYCLAGTTLAREVRDVFLALDRGLDEGRRQVARIVGRDTMALTDQEVRRAALETLAENLNDGVVAPLFWYIVAGVPGMLAYKMVNTLDSMVGYRTERYRLFGCFAARMDDVAGWLPARLTALLMVLVAGRPRLLAFVRRYGPAHASPNSGYPESALAGILDCRFGGPHNYFGEEVWKPFIGHNDRPLTRADLHTALSINLRSELLMLVLTAACSLMI